EWDAARKYKNNKAVLFYLLTQISKTNKELADNLSNCELLDETSFSKTQISPYFKQPVKRQNDKLFLGVGEAIYKIDPITGQGYNSGADIVNQLVCFDENYESYTQRKLEELYHI